MGGCDCGKIVGVRIQESANRAKLWSEFVRNKYSKTAFYLCPIAYWTTKDVWDFHKLRNLPHCCLYDQGFTRLGCIGGPLAGPKSQARAFARLPAYEQMRRRSFDKFWDKWHGVPTLTGKRRYFEDMESAQGFWDWWRSGKRQEKGPTCQGGELFANLELDIDADSDLTMDGEGKQ